MLPVLSPTPLLVVVVRFKEKVTCTLAVALTQHGALCSFPRQTVQLQRWSAGSSLRKRLGIAMLFHRPWRLLEVPFEALAKCTWLFIYYDYYYCCLFLKQSEGRDDTSSCVLPEGAARTSKTVAHFHVGHGDQALSSSSSRQPNLVVVPLHLLRARWVLLLRSTMNVFISSSNL